MFTNEKGSALIFVLLMVVMFSILGLSVLGATVSTGKRTELQEDQVESVQQAKKAIQQGVVLLQSYFEDYSLKDMKAYNNEVKSFEDIELSYSENGSHVTYTITNVTNEIPSIDPTTNYTRVFDIRSEASVDGTGGAPPQVHSFSKRVFLSATPTALQNGIGSKETLTLNGSPSLIGNVYAGKLLLSETGNYIFGNTQPAFKTEGLAVVTPASSTFLQQQQAIVSITNTANFLTVRQNDEFLSNENSEFALENSSGEKYQGIDVQKTFQDKSTQHKPPISEETCIAFDTFGNIIQTPSNQEAYILSSACPGAPEGIKDFVLYESDKLTGADKWLYVEGNLTIYGSKPDADGDDVMNIEQNILIDGDLNITGTIRFNSAIYTTGTSEIYNTNIIGDETEQLALFSKGDLTISRINEFENPVEKGSSLKSFFYSEKQIELYAVGSYIHIIGGIFSAKDLTVNAARGVVGYKDVKAGRPIGLTDGLPRLKIDYDPTIVFNKSTALPRVERLQVFSNSLIEHTYSSQ
ncbi:hypothetical protein ACFFGV_02425 [Pontibacillus salicampi]|uniref:Type II secretion system protein n=1 Tax=Pontibacillus salicampi TaxID=1449801 RepID=A0ABV6LJ80_9BACI